jgi:hypothetical protein
MKTKVKYNLTTALALPLLGWKKAMYKPYLVNAYIKHEGIDRFDKNHLFVLLKWEANEDYKKVEKVLTSSKFCASYYSPDRDGNLMMFVMKVPKSLREDYYKFLDGQYSKMSKRAKNIIMESSVPGGKIYRILYKEKSLKEEMEEKVGQPLDDSLEVYSSVQDINLNLKHGKEC